MKKLRSAESVIAIQMKWSICLLFLFFGCTNPEKSKKLPPVTAVEAATDWADMTLYITKNTFANTPTYASRALGYIGLTMYESVVWSDSHYRSIASQLNGFNQLPKPFLNMKYNWLLTLNAGQASILKKIYSQTSDINKLKIDSLEKAIRRRCLAGEPDEEVMKRSIAFGQALADTIFERSKSDGGYRGYLHNFDPKFLCSNKPGSWKPSLYSQVVAHFPLHPYWGKNRTFVNKDAEIPVPSFIPNSSSKESPCYQQFLAVYQKNKTLTQEEKEIALWWNDDPGETFTPPGHSYNLATCVIKTVRPGLVKCAETYARVGIAVADAFIDCWKWKYMFFSERPETYTNNMIDADWESFWPNPPFPAFPSGHAIQAASVATVLTDLYGDHFAFVDVSHKGRNRDEVRNVDYKPRRFASFWQVAQETAKSRFFGGIHTQQDNDMGLQKGKEVGTNVNQLKWYN